MKTFEEIRNVLQRHKPYLAQRYGIREIGIFGSYVRNEQRPDSDLDILIELENPPCSPAITGDYVYYGCNHHFQIVILSDK